MKRNGYIFLFLNLFISVNITAQEIPFGDFSSLYTVTVTELLPGTDLDFGTIVENEGINTIDITNSKVLVIEGTRYLDITVDITADQYLLLVGGSGCETDPSCRIPFTLQAAYANRGINNTSQASVISIIASTGSARFPIKYRGNAPPGPPPTPVYEGFDLSALNEDAFLYLYGSVNVGSVQAGDYTGNISITFNYE